MSNPQVLDLQPATAALKAYDKECWEQPEVVEGRVSAYALIESTSSEQLRILKDCYDQLLQEIAEKGGRGARLVVDKEGHCLTLTPLRDYYEMRVMYLPDFSEVEGIAGDPDEQIIGE